MPPRDPDDACVQRGQGVSGSERANDQLFIGELCLLLDVPAPDPALGRMRAVNQEATAWGAA